ncbi:exopolysaccharide biosynthesis polyprenyl glycosylphosphotransferase (plasmid) [Deinococcus proteolyticus MRP]|uniref:Exopolysaccharide biosynthesis polyprenyl glycosylphosphotransferase n=2 Tax=Deinococcaceae TaxID=183710 RepID=F0RQY8_DEIPM|nr:exopolysaccharide biosynthesis polyprenyl glycosylphosphotransferase [Deinococcus proteolyticus MRP]
MFCGMAVLVWMLHAAAIPGFSGMGGGAEQGLLTRLWLVAGILGVLLSHRSTLSEAGSAYLLPLAAFGVAAALFAAAGYAEHIALLVPVHLLWLLLTAAVQVALQRRRPPVRLGMLAAPDPELLPYLQERHLRPTVLSAQEPAALQQVDALVVRPEQYSALQQRVLEHAQLMNLPVVSGRLLEEELTGRVSLDDVDETWVTPAAFQTGYLPWKRFFDVFFTLVSLPVLLPLMAVVAAVVYFNSGRPILFWQERVGRGGQPFQLVKFRTMTRDSERSGPAFAKQGDQRITPVGAFLRKFRLDELPQFWNVLRGEMSIIGPRPEQWAFTVEFEESIPMYSSRHWVRPGITGWAQVTQGYTDSVGQITEKLRYDFYYVKHCSLALDLQIVWKTVMTILTGFGSR